MDELGGQYIQQGCKLKAERFVMPLVFSVEWKVKSSVEIWGSK